MKQFVITYIDRQGQKVTHTLTAPSEDAVRTMAVRRSWNIIAVKEKTSILSAALRLRPFSYKTLSLLFYQFEVMTRAGIPLVQVFRLLSHDMTPKKRRQAMDKVVINMEKGMTVSEALAQTGLFPPLSCRIISAGERAGNLEQMLHVLGQYYEKAGNQQRLFADILLYPIFLLICTMGIFIGIVLFVLPVFEAMFSQTGIPLPVLTSRILSLTHVLQSYGSILAVAAVSVVIGLAALLQRPSVRICVEHQLFRISIIRRCCIVFCWQQFSQIMAMQLRCGIPLLTALEDGASVVSVAWFRRAASQAACHLENGCSFSFAVQRCKISTAYIETMLLVGESTGQYEDVLQAIAEYYCWRIQSWLALAQRLLGPILILIVGMVIGILVISLLLPLLDMAAGIVP